MSNLEDEKWMQEALALADQAESLNEVPVGAILVLDNQVIGRGYNRPISESDPCAHAEIIAIREAAKHLGNYRLLNTTLYVTLEPCLMCVGAMVHARINQLVFGAFDPKSGVVTTCANMLDLLFLNHRVTYRGGVLADNCGEKLKEFFRKRRVSG